jgi:long-chain fatty acid transport protein
VLEGLLSRMAMTAVSVLLATTAKADYIESLGVSEACIALGGACVATADDFGAYYVNPAGATQFDHAIFGGNFRILDTRSLDLQDSDGSHGIYRTNARGALALAPTLAGYYPVSSRITVGLAFGAPFAITADWGNDAGINRFDMSDQSLFLLDLSPNIAFKLNDKLSVGLAVNITALKQLQTETLIPSSFFAALPPALGGAGTIIPTTPHSPVLGSVTLQTSKDVSLGIPPDSFESAFNEATFTVGVRYQQNDRLSFGAAYRNITRTTFRGTATLDLTPINMGSQSTGFTTALDMPGHVELGAAYQVVPARLTWSLDAERTFWAQTRGFGSPANIRFQQPLLGLINNLKISYDGHDANTYRTGIKYQVTPIIAVMGGYAYDQRVFHNNTVDILTYDSNRNIYSLGGSLDLRSSAKRGWLIATDAQMTHYDRNTLQTGESSNLGGLSLPNLSAGGTLGFVSNRGPFTFGGNIWGFGVSATYAF